MAVAAFIRLSDSGVPLDPGLRRVLEESFSVDLSGVRLHAGPRTAAFLRRHGCPAAAAGHRVFMPAARRGDSERWLYVLVHEIAHVVQQAQGVAQAGGCWELQAAAAAAAVMTGRAYPDAACSRRGKAMARPSWPASTRGNIGCSATYPVAGW
jgi:Domain of unknown function (DUF4157)